MDAAASQPPGFEIQAPMPSSPWGVSAGDTISRGFTPQMEMMRGAARPTPPPQQNPWSTAPHDDEPHSSLGVDAPPYEPGGGGSAHPAHEARAATAAARSRAASLVRR